MKSIVIMGIGNLLFSDEGIGVHVARELMKRDLPENIKVYDAGTLGILSAPLFEGSDLLILIDAVDAPGKAGEVKIYSKDEIMLSNIPLKLTPHQIGIQETLLVSEMRGVAPKEVIFFGAIPKNYDTSDKLTPDGEKAKEKILAELEKYLV
ncbi:MAG: HyaD/HybD family hydrogenase maturation endopeptidase [Deferribacteraceae bacterium]|jgi:hydrogenase maturation protease|nr:HyaD/HybD family hydrogenase maturation endopeptidase [Deferribacteraceae bacterium]